MAVISRSSSNPLTPAHKPSIPITAMTKTYVGGCQSAKLRANAPFTNRPHTLRSRCYQSMDGAPTRVAHSTREAFFQNAIRYRPLWPARLHSCCSSDRRGVKGTRTALATVDPRALSLTKIDSSVLHRLLIRRKGVAMLRIGEEHACAVDLLRVHHEAAGQRTRRHQYRYPDAQAVAPIAPTQVNCPRRWQTRHQAASRMRFVSAFDGGQIAAHQRQARLRRPARTGWQRWCSSRVAFAGERVTSSAPINRVAARR